MNYDVTSLLADIRRRASIPNSAVTGSQDSDLLAHVNNVLQLTLANKLISVREGFLRRNYDTAITSSTRYRIPARALGNRLAAVLLLDGNGNVVRKLSEISYDMLTELRGINDAGGYILEADEIVLAPAVPTSGIATIRMVYYICPNQVTDSLNVASGRCFTITNVSSTQVTIMSSHGLTTSSVLDIVKQGAPFAHSYIDISPSATGATTLTLSSTSGISIGDFVCQSQYSPRAQIPDAMYPLLAHLAAMEFLKSVGDLSNHKRLAEELLKLEKEAIEVIAPRVEQGPKKIMSNKGVLGPVAWSGRGRGWGW